MHGTAPPDGFWTRNLRALACCDPRLAARLCEPMEGSHIETLTAASGALTAKFTEPQALWIHSPEDPVAEAERSAFSYAPADGAGPLCLGVGLGYELHSWRRRVPPTVPLFAYERDPWLLRMALVCQDFSKDLLARRIVFLLGTDLARLDHAGPIPIIRHPVLGPLYQDEELYLTERGSERFSRRAMVAAGGLFVRDVAEGLRELGVTVLAWDPKHVSRRESLHQIRQWAPDFVFSINYLKGLPELCRDAGVQAIVWEIDPGIERLTESPRGAEQTRIYTYRKAHVARYRQAGFKHVEYLPLAANPRRRRPLSLKESDRLGYAADIAFVGNSMVAQADELRSVFCRVCEVNGVPEPARLWQRIVRNQSATCDLDTWAAGLATALAEHGLNRVILNDAEGRGVDLGACLGEKAASDRRLHLVNALAERGRNVAVWGDDGWRRGAPKARYRGWAGHDRELTKIYNAARINLDIGRLYQNDIVTMRVYDVLACQGFALVEYSSALGELFDLGHEVAAFRSLSELDRLVDYFLTHERDRLALAEAGHRKVLRDHTITGRLRQVLGDLEAGP